MTEPQRIALTALYAAMLGVLGLPLSEGTRVRLADAARSLARDLNVPCPLPTREERRAGRVSG